MRVTLMRKFYRVVQWPIIALGAMITGVSPTGASQQTSDDSWDGASSGVEPVILPNTLNSRAPNLYAAHRSHASHGSHRSGSGGSRAPTPRPTPSPQQTAPTPPAYVPSPQVQPNQGTTTGTVTAPKPSQQQTSMMVVRVQAALMRLGFYQGDIDGSLGPNTRAAIRAYQTKQGIKQTGRMDLDTLTRLGIPIQ